MHNAVDPWRKGDCKMEEEREHSEGRGGETGQRKQQCPKVWDRFRLNSKQNKNSVQLLFSNCTLVRTNE